LAGKPRNSSSRDYPAPITVLDFQRDPSELQVELGSFPATPEQFKSSPAGGGLSILKGQDGRKRFYYLEPAAVSIPENSEFSKAC
jgi:hypothetical protein